MALEELVLKLIGDLSLLLGRAGLFPGGAAKKISAPGPKFLPSLP
jgi:hypothetical protein